MSNNNRSILLYICLMTIMGPLTHAGCSDGAVGNDNNNNATDGCLCKKQDDVVQDKTCVRSDFTCNALNPCDDDYHCDSSNQCVCTNPDVCGISCSVQCGCPTETVCDLSTSTCRDRMSCLDDSMCSQGQLCQEIEATEYQCTTPSGAEVGESCSEHWDCLSGICHTGICLQPCESNSSCPAGQFCDIAVNHRSACVVSTACQNCTAPNQICDFPDSCVESCRTSADCPDDCKVRLGWPLYGKCDDTIEGDCSDDEFIMDNYPETSFCVIYQSCWTQADCPTDYQCHTSYEMRESLTNASFCARPII